MSDIVLKIKFSIQRRYHELFDRVLVTRNQF